MAKKEENEEKGEIELKTGLKRTGEPKLVLTELLKEWSSSKGSVNGGEAICEQPKDQALMLNPTTPMGHGNLLYAKLTYTMPKYYYNLEKLDEFIVVSPSYPEMYGRVIAKKREVEGQIKAGLASAAQAVADFELLKHDERKYREILDYFKEGSKDEHILRALFVDRVDAHMGEAYSMISMTKRWPTIITDFLRISTIEKDDRKDIRKVAKALHVPVAEGTVLKTKNELFEEWKRTFFPDIRDRYVRVKNLVDARRKSVDEYKEWLKPYVSNLKMMREMTESDPSYMLTRAVSPWHKPNAWYGVRLWMWKTLTAEEVGKPGFVSGEIKPYDDFVKRYKKKIEDQYEIKIVKDGKEAVKYFIKKGFAKDEEDAKKLLKADFAKDDLIIVKDLLEEAKEARFYEKEARLNPNMYYYCLYDIDIISPLFKMEAGKEEVDDWNAMITPYLVSQNVILMALLEIEAKKKWLNKYVKELIGVREIEDKLRVEVEKRYPDLEPKEKKKMPGKRIKDFYFRVTIKERREKLTSRVNNWWFDFKPRGRIFLKYFMRIGPYETVSKERMSKMYGRYMGGSMTDPFIKFLKEQIGKLSGVQPP